MRGEVAGRERRKAGGGWEHLKLENDKRENA